ncbi:MAG: hypothetical protein AAFQ94_11675 [Bacteroidota bacterium]
MKKILSIMLIMLTSVFTGFCQPGSNSDIIRQNIIEVSLNNVERYLEFLPQDYDPNGSTLYPVIIFLHGQGERDNNLLGAYKVAKLGLPRLIEEENYNMCYTVDGEEKCFIVISPQLQATRSNGQNLKTWSAGFTNSVINHVLANYQVDPDRVYLTGHSMGGIGVYKYASHSSNGPNRIAAAAPIAANGLNDSQGCIISERKINLRHFHGDSDSVIGPESGRNTFDKIANCTTPAPVADLRFVLYEGNIGHNKTPNIAHDSTERLDGQNIYEWFLSHTLGDNETTNLPPVASAGNDLTITLPDDSVIINGSASDPDGTISNITWTQTSGTPLTLEGENNVNLTVKDLVAGTFEFTLTISDDQGETASDSMILTVESPVTTEMGTISEKFLASKSLPYLEYLPPNYNTSSDRYPVLIYFHSEDAKGLDSLELIRNEGPFYYIDQETDNFCFTIDGEEQCFIVIAPQVEVGKGFFKGKVNALYNEIVNAYHSDTTQIYVSGYDDGANGMFTRLLDPENNPNRYAGIAAVGTKISNSSDPIAVGQLEPKIWMAHSQSDNEYPIATAKQFYQDMISVNPNSDTLFVEYNSESHLESMFRAFDPSDSLSFYNWLFNEVTIPSDSTPTTTDSTGTVSERRIESRNLPFLEYLPPNYTTAGNRYPVLIYLHSEAAKGTDSLDLVAQEGPFYHIIQEGKDFCFTIDGEEKCFIVLAPQVEVGKGFSKGRLNGLIDEALNNYHSDANQLYITGADDGANNLFVRLLDSENSPNRFAGIGVAGLKVTSSLDEQAIGIINPKLWVGHSLSDSQFPYQDALDFYNDVRSTTTSGDTLFFTYNSLTHEESIESAFDPTSTESMYDWLFSNQTGSQARNTNHTVEKSPVGELSEQNTFRKDFLVTNSTVNRLFTDHEEDNELLIFNYSGQVVSIGTVKESLNAFTQSSNGIYFYRIKNNRNILIQKGRILKR